MVFGKGSVPQIRATAEFNRKRTAELTLKNWTQRQIAEELGVDRSTVSNYLRDVRKEWREERLEDAETLVERELAALAQMEKDTAALFDKFNPAETDIDIYSSSREASEWVKARLKIMEQRHKLLGLYKPVKVDIESKNENININAEQSAEIRKTILNRLTPKHGDSKSTEEN